MQVLQTKNTDPASVLNLQTQPNNQGPQSSSGQGFGLFSGKFENSNPFLEALRPTDSSPIQTKRTIGQPNDPYEQEADRIAEQVVSTSHPVQRKCAACEQEEKIQPKTLASQITPLRSSFAQRKCAACAAEEKLQGKFVQMKGEAGTASSQLESQINASKGGGSPMGADTQSFMSDRFGADFSEVRVHTGSESVQMNQALGAKAFTVGNDIHFNEGAYNPGSTEGKKLLAHELAHSVQQNKMSSSFQIMRKIQNSPDTAPAPPSPPKVSYFFLDSEIQRCGDELLVVIDAQGNKVDIRQGESKSLRISQGKINWLCGNNPETVSPPQQANYLKIVRTEMGRKSNWYFYHRFQSDDSTQSQINTALPLIDRLVDTGLFQFDWAVTDREASRVIDLLYALRPKALIWTTSRLKAKNHWKKLKDNVPASRKNDFIRLDARIHPWVGYLMPGDTINLKIYSEKPFQELQVKVNEQGVQIPGTQIQSPVTELDPNEAIEVINRDLIQQSNLIEPLIRFSIIRRGIYYPANEQGPFSDLPDYSPSESRQKSELQKRALVKKASFNQYLESQKEHPIPNPFMPAAMAYYGQWMKTHENLPEFMLISPEALWKQSLQIAYEALNPAELDSAHQLPESIYAVTKTELSFYRSPNDPEPTQITVPKGQKIELTWQIGEWYYAHNEQGHKGYLKASSLHLPPKDASQPGREEFVAVIGDILFIQAPDMNRAFKLAKKSSLTPNVGMIFWYGNGRSKPYPVDYKFTLPEPTAAELEALRKEGGISPLTISGTTTKSSLPPSTPPERKLNPQEKRWQEAEVELRPSVDKFMQLKSEKQPGKLVFQVPHEWFTKIWEIFNEFAGKKGIAVSQDRDSDYQYYYTVFELTIQFQIKEDATRYGLHMTDQQEVLGTLSWLTATRQKLLEYNKAALNKKLEVFIEEEQAKRKSDIEAFFKPYKDALEKEQQAFIEKINEKIKSMTDTVKQDYERKKAIKVLEERQKEWLNKAQKEFEASKISQEIREAVEKRYVQEQEKIVNQDPYTLPALAQDDILRNMVKYFENELGKMENFDKRNDKLNSAYEKISTYLRKNHPENAPYLSQVIFAFFTKKLLLDGQGSIKAYAIKKWASISEQDIAREGPKYAEVYREHFDREYRGMMTSPTAFSMETLAYMNLVEELAYARAFFKKIVEHPEKDEGFWDGFLSKELHEFIPFIHTIIDILKLKKMMETANRAKLGARLSLPKIFCYAPMPVCNKFRQCLRSLFGIGSEKA
ncbi:MAG: DUF4157 domain-containing protein [Bacteroidia bacterium]|nr:DUF4157 domain-containing protein [Bacteroidia bacterium]